MIHALHTKRHEEKEPDKIRPLFVLFRVKRVDDLFPLCRFVWRALIVHFIFFDGNPA